MHVGLVTHLSGLAHIIAGLRNDSSENDDSEMRAAMSTNTQVVFARTED